MNRSLFSAGILTVTTALLVGALLPVHGIGETKDSSPLRFNRDIRPVLSDNCFACHGPDSAQRKADLRLDTAEGLFGKDGDSGPVVRGKPEESELYQRIISDSPSRKMPPPKSHKKLSPEQQTLVKRWIEQGAPWEPHWSFVPPQRPTLPTVKNTAWVRNPIDAFILAKLEERHLTPAPEADRRALLRRVTFDLTGLPPTPDEVEAFLKDTSPNAYEKVVDRLLASPHWGEHRGRYWLDAARYGDTHGLHIDNYREIWPYRDWVINAFNRNLPFDRFTIEQIAGDLLPNPTLDQRVASGFHRCNITTNEGGVIAEEVDAMYQKDRVETTATVWLGLTMGCASCHDHKFDPVSTRDFYAMVAFFKNTTQRPLDGNIRDTPPILFVPRAEDRPRWEALQTELSGVKQKLQARKQTAHTDFLAWLQRTKPADLKARVSGNQLHLYAPLAEGKGNAAGISVEGEPRAISAATLNWTNGPAGNKAYLAEAQNVLEIPDAGDFEKDQPFSIALWVNLARRDEGGAILARMEEANAHRGWDVWVERGRVGMHLIHAWEQDALKVVSQTPVPAPRTWAHVAITYDGSAKAEGIKVYVDGVPQTVDILANSLKGTTRTKVPLKLAQRHASLRLNRLGLSDLRLYRRVLAPEEIAQLQGAALLARVSALPEKQRAGAEQEKLLTWWLRQFDESSRALSAKIIALQNEEQTLRQRGAVTHVMQEKPGSMAKARILFRGQYDQPREEVLAAVPSVLPSLSKEAPRNRLGLAQWLMAKENPLTARVTVNRFWQEVFGTGLVRTSEDFGIMGENPSHPELLDWLAVEFRDSGWDVKRFFKLLVTSATYRQAAVTTLDKLKKDPNNRLLSRGPRFRLDAEMLRDNALAVSGLLVRKIGGPSVRPYQPPGIWEAVAMKESDTRSYKVDAGENLYRRSMYTFWKRSAPPASMDIFNAPSRENCCVRRERTNTPLQALVTMNDPQFVEAARVLSQRMLKDTPADFNRRLDYLTLHILARPFEAKERAVCLATWQDFKAHYDKQTAEAQKLIATGASKPDASLPPGELAAWTLLTSQLLNLDETLNK
jgi:hypothetical protein